MTSSARRPVTPADITAVAALAAAALRAVPDAAYDARATHLEWTRWQTAEHIVDCHFAYACQLSPPVPPLDSWPRFKEQGDASGPKPVVGVEREAGADGLADVLLTIAGILDAVVRAKPPETRAFHSYGVADPEGFAAMAVVESAVHMYDLLDGTGVAWAPPEDVVARALARLFPEVAVAPEGAYATLLWATSRTDLPGREPVTGPWRWHSAPLQD